MIKTQRYRVPKNTHPARKADIYIKMAKDYHIPRYGDHNDYSLIKKVKKRIDKVSIICKIKDENDKIHGLFILSLHHHISGDGCPKCRYIKTSKSNTLPQKDYFDSVNKIHNNQFKYLSEYKGRRYDITYECPRCGIREINAGLHNTKRPGRDVGCTFCKKNKRKIKKIIGGKYKKYKKEKRIYEKEKIQIKKYKSQLVLLYCKKEEENKLNFLKNLNKILINHINKQIKIKSVKNYNILKLIIKTQRNIKLTHIKNIEAICKSHIRNQKKKINIKKVEKYHQNTYDYSKISFSKTKNITTERGYREWVNNIYCKQHNIYFKQRYDALKALRMSCSECKHHNTLTRCKQMSDTTRMGKKKFIEASKARYGDKTISYDNVVYKNATTKVTMYCITHNIKFEIIPHSHLHNNKGCHKCDHSKTSKVAQEWIKFLLLEYPNLQHFDTEDGEFKPLKDRNYKADGYDEETNTIFEFNGCYWHGCKRPNCIMSNWNPNDTTHWGASFADLYNKTTKKREELLNAGYHYICIWECEFKTHLKTLQLIKKNIEN